VNVIEGFRSKLNSPKAKIYIVSIAWLAGCFFLLIPTIRYLIISIGEILLNRSLDHQVWHERFIVCGMVGILEYILFSCIYVFYINRKLFNISKILITLFIFAYCLVFACIIMYRANFYLGSDDYDLMNSVLINKYIKFVPYIGRFTPSNILHCNIVLFLYRCFGINTGTQIGAHFFVVVLLFIITFLCLYNLFRNCNSLDNGKYFLVDLFFSCTFFATSVTFVNIFMVLIYGEAVLISFFSLFMLMYYKAIKTDKTIYYIFAFLVAIYCTYFKEIVFGIFIVIAITNHLFRYKKESKQERIFYFALILNSIVFMILYYFFSYRNTTYFYQSFNPIELPYGRLSLIIFLVKDNPVFILMFLFGLFRIYFIVFRNDREHMFYDSLLLAAIAFFLAYIILRFNHSYLVIPSLILFYPSFVYWIKQAFKRIHIYILPCLLLIILAYAYNIYRQIPVIKNYYYYRNLYALHVNGLISEYNKGKEFIWYETGDDIDFTRDWRLSVEENYMRFYTRNEDGDFFTKKKYYEYLGYLQQDVLFFYPIENGRYQPFSEELEKFLLDNNYIIDPSISFYGIRVYKKQ